METPTRQRVVIDLVSDDEGDVSRAIKSDKRSQGNFREFPDFLVDQLADAGPAPWDQDALLGQASPILGDWRGDFLPPVDEQVNWPEFLQQAGFPNPAALPQQQFDHPLDDIFLPAPLNQVDSETANRTGSETGESIKEHIRSPSPGVIMRNKTRCLDGVADIFKDICRDHMEQLYDQYEGKKTVANLTEVILQEVEMGNAYPTTKQLKRKRSKEEEKDDAHKYMLPNEGEMSPEYSTYV
jgi:hypothetical protein